MMWLPLKIFTLCIPVAIAIMKKSGRVAVVLTIIGAVLGITFVVYDARQNNDRVKEIATLKADHSQLKAQIEPFHKLANDRYPKLTSEKALTRLQGDFKELERKQELLSKKVESNDKIPIPASKIIGPITADSVDGGTW